MPRIETKAEMYAAMKAGMFGNVNPHWYTYDEYLKSRYRKAVGIRSTTPGGLCKYNIGCQCIRKELSRHWPSGGFAISPMIESSKLLIQGEICRTVGGLYLFYSTHKAPMRDALAKQPMHAEGVKVKVMLEYYLDFYSLENLYRLLDFYEDAVIEFSTFSIPVGTLKLNTVIWEVRHY